MATGLQQTRHGAAGLRSCSAGAHMRSSFAPSFGGILSLNAASEKGSKKHGIPGQKLSKESYAMALQEQIDARKARPAEDNSTIQDFIVGRDGDGAVDFQRKMGFRHGGPMAPTSRESYALALQEQIALRDAHRARNERAASLPPAIEEAPADNPCYGKGKRCQGAIALDSQESYARALRMQIVTRAEKRAADAQHSPDAAVCLQGLREEAEQAKGRRHIGPLDAHAKSSYVLALQEQVEAREAQREAEHALRKQTVQGDAHPGDLAAWTRGRRHESNIAQASKDELNWFLQRQMKERSVVKAAEAFHRQAPQEVQVPAEQVTAGKRLMAPMVRPSAKDYAMDLKQQIEIRERQRAAEGVAGYPREASRDRDAAATETPTLVKGRRHQSQMAPVSKESLACALKQQMAAREADRAANAFHIQRLGDGEAVGELARLDNLANPFPLQPGAPPSTVENGHPPTVMGEDTSAPAVGNSKFARNGAALLGMSSASDTRKTVAFSDWCEDADAHERAMVQKIVDARAKELNKLLGD